LAILSTVRGQDASAIPDARSGSASRLLSSNGDFLAAMVAQINKSEYEIRWQDTVSAYQSPNRAQNLRFTYLGHGFVAENRVYDGETPPWRVKIALEAFGSDPATINKPHLVQWEVQKNTARLACEGVSVHYINDEAGMRQSFILDDRPTGGQGLSLVLLVETQGVFMQVDEAENAVCFVRDDGSAEEAMCYTGLLVWDANEQVLPSRMVQLGANRFAIMVDDSEAVYPLVVDPISKVESLTGDQSSAAFGHSVAGSGDIQAAGSGGVVIGAPYYDNGEVSEGRVFVYSSPNGTLPSSPTWTAEIDQAGANLGYSVAFGDFNGDGFYDIVAGAPWYNAAGYTDNGRVFIWAGSADGLAGGTNGTSANALWQKSGSQQSYAKFGYSVASAGNVNADDYDDVIIGAPHYDYSGTTDCGCVYVYHGSTNGPSSSSNWAKIGQHANYYFGYSVFTAGDVNGDDYADVIIGAPDAEQCGTVCGAAYVYHGSASGLSSSANQTLYGDQGACKFGSAVSTARDITNDGYDDVIIGSRNYDNGQTDEGMVFVYYGSSSGVGSSCQWSAQSNQASARFGWSVAGGDVNSDGYSDVIVGAPNYDVVSSNNGRTFLWYGSSSGLGSNGTPDNADWDSCAINEGAYYGYSVAYLERYEYHSGPGFVVGAPYDDDVGEATVWSAD
jgi:hypothetical protein